jgi:flavin-dependent dehydrogenase
VEDRFDVAIVGGGPAGAGLAGALARRGRRVIVLERSRYAEPRIGETFGGELAPTLRALGAWEAMAVFLVRGQLPFRAVQAAWGTSTLEERPSIVHPLGEGWHVDRARFDERLAAWAEDAGAVIRRGAGTCTAARAEGGFAVVPRHGAPVLARYLVDASGRGAPATARLGGRRWVASDRQVALIARLPRVTAVDPEPHVLVETVPEGFWYTAPQPDGGLVVVLLTDADLAPAGARADLPARFRSALGRTTHTAARTGALGADLAVTIARADSGRLVPDRGDGFRALGDAAMSTDPLGGNGVPRALRAAAEAAAEIDAELAGGPPAPSPIERRFARYVDRRASYYAIEGRWPDEPFWARRRPIDWRTAAITLPPDTPIRWARDLSPRDLAPVEALLPPRALNLLRAHLTAAPAPVHEVLARIRPLAPSGDRRLVIAAQMLIARGAVEASASSGTALGAR